jgi:hypothetical protein
VFACVAFSIDDQDHTFYDDCSHPHLARWLGRSQRFPVSSVDVVERPVEPKCKMAKYKFVRGTVDPEEQRAGDDDPDHSCAISLFRAKVLTLAVGAAAAFG